MTHHLNHTHTAVVSQTIEWLPVDADTPQGVKCLVIDRTQGIAYLRDYLPGCGWTHWHPLPRFQPDAVWGGQ